MVLEVNNQSASINDLEQTKLFKKRWFMLLLYMVVVPCGALQWTQYVVVADVIVDYYQVSYEDVNWTNLITVLFFVMFSLPSGYVIDKYGCRKSAIISGIGICVATWIKVVSVSPDKFWLVIFAQAVLAIFQSPMFNMPPKIAANWFGPDEVSMACSMGLTGTQVGLALGFVLPPYLIKKKTVEGDLFMTNIGIAVVCTIAALLLIFYKPSVPPSYAAMNQSHQTKYIESAKVLIKNISFLLIVLGFGLNLAIYVVVQTILNQLVLKFYPDGAKDVGWIGLLIVISGICGSIVTGYLLDKYKVFRLLLLFFGFSVTLALTGFTYTLHLHIIYAYTICPLFGFLSSSFWYVCLQIAIETTYPQPEIIIFGLLNAFGELLGIGYTYVYSYLFYEIHVYWANTFLCINSMVSFLILLFTKYELKRLKENSKQSETDVPQLDVLKEN
ncbi:hypothetical protein RN001_007594 [Aquatica leii]|uniref:Major facilitator superfamily (MFS) profile domain-containing protein n=1 Tax=Aquatica leii TaxID=1421715 RepID=A0AAN7SNX9_9COLE|nr:hypothetical protein RN001_007594 [Aquatica leii]